MQSDTLEMKDGREIHLERLTQWLTYEGLLEGTPTHDMNQKYLAGLRARPAERAFERSCYVVRPQERRVLRAGLDVELGWLPRITCVGLFVSHERARDPDADMSSLRIFWLQDNFALPIAQDPLAQIKTLDWAVRAADGWI